MATRPKRWPNRAAWARDDAIMELHIVKKLLREVIHQNGQLDEAQQLRILAAALCSTQDALRALEAVR